jgi:hypothetical protein
MAMVVAAPRRATLPVARTLASTRRRSQRCPRCCDREGDRGDRARGVDQKGSQIFSPKYSSGRYLLRVSGIS